jgi:predicted nucleic acid-binding protein
LKQALLDANLLIAMFLQPAHPLLDAARGGESDFVICPYVITEARRMVRNAFPYRLAEFDRFIRDLPARRVGDASPASLARWADFLSDPADVPVLAAAIEAGLDAVVTSDRIFRADAQATLALEDYPIRVVGVSEFLRE